LTLEFSGSYFDLSDFAYRAEQLVAGPGRLLTVKSIKLQLGGTNEGGTAGPVKSSPGLAVSMTLYAFSMQQTAAAQPSASASTTAQAGVADAANTTTTTRNSGLKDEANPTSSYGASS
jgi:hypothetical protein